MHVTQFTTRIPLKTCALTVRSVHRWNSLKGKTEPEKRIVRLAPDKTPASHKFARSYKRLFRGIKGALTWTQLNRALNTVKPAKKKVMGTPLSKQNRSLLLAKTVNPSYPGPGSLALSGIKVSRKQRIAARRAARQMSDTERRMMLNTERLSNHIARRGKKG